MIRIPRCRTTNGEVIRPADGWFDEAEEQRQAAIDDGADHEVTDVYRAPEVRAALEELFYHKCAYCETRITAGFSWDAECYLHRRGIFWWRYGGVYGILGMHVTNCKPMLKQKWRCIRWPVGENGWRRTATQARSAHSFRIHSSGDAIWQKVLWKIE